MLRGTLMGFALLLAGGVVAQQANPPPTDNEIVVVGKRLAMARANYSLQGHYLRSCFIGGTSGDAVFDKRVCVEAKACAEQGFRREREMTDCVNRRLIIWERGRQESRILAQTLDAQARQTPPTGLAAALAIADDAGLLRPGSWEVRRSDAAAPRTLCLRPGGRSDSILSLLYTIGQEQEAIHGSCARWIFSHQGNTVSATRRCFQPVYRLDGQLEGTLGPETAEIEAIEETGTSARDMQKRHVLWSAKRTGDCPS